MSDLFPTASQSAMDFPQPLVEKYRPTRIADFIALDKPKRLLATLVKSPRPCNLIFAGPPGCGKTSMGLAFAKELNAGLIHFPAQTLTVDAVKVLWDRVQYYPESGGYWVVICDEIETASPQARYALLSKMDSAANLVPTFGGGMRQGQAPRVVFIMTCNGSGDDETDVSGMFEPRFLSRCMVVPFTKPNGELSQYLAAIWDNEGDFDSRPDFTAIADGAEHCVRDALQALDLELMTASATIGPLKRIAATRDAEIIKEMRAGMEELYAKDEDLVSDSLTNDLENFNRMMAH